MPTCTDWYSTVLLIPPVSDLGLIGACYLGSALSICFRYSVLSAAERRGTPVLLSASVSDNFGNSPQIAAPRRSREIDQSMQCFYVGWFHVGWQGIGDQSDVVTQNAWFRCARCAAISGEISILIPTGAESWGRFPVPRICRWESRYSVPKLRYRN